MIKHLQTLPLAWAICLSAGAAEAQTAAKNLFPGAQTGTLTVKIDLSGNGRNTLPNGVEWHGLAPSRSLELKLAMLDPGVTNVPLVKVGGNNSKSASSVASMPPGMQEMAAAIEACDGDENCERAAMTKLAPKIQANPQAYNPAASSNAKRYQNWVNDRRTVCAKGTMSVNDRGEGVIISPPEPARPYSFARAGQVSLPDGKEATVEAACSAEITFDKTAGKASLSLPARGLSIPVKLTGHAFTSEKSVAFIEGVDKIQIVDAPAGKTANGWRGESTVRIGSVSHNSGQVVVPVTAKVSWRFDVTANG